MDIASVDTGFTSEPCRGVAPVLIKMFFVEALTKALTIEQNPKAASVKCHRSSLVREEARGRGTTAY
ncbi:hypothetical protein B0H12DRAFT_411667 [Mycena haematopus]|nr:hypothetical protein B0H12DRAFT_411667 [Mycena haematopus]